MGLVVAATNVHETEYHLFQYGQMKTLCGQRKKRSLPFIPTRIFGQTTDVHWCPECGEAIGVTIARDPTEAPDWAKRLKAS